MSLSGKYPHLTPEMTRNVREKVRHFYSIPQEKDVLTVAVYGDFESASSKMWYSIFRPGVNFYFSTDVAAMPIPPHYESQKYEPYKKELREYIAEYVRSKNLIWDLYNVSTFGEEPRMHLVLANQRIKKSELGQWAQSEKPSLRGSRSSLKESGGEGSGTVPSSPLRGSRSSLKESGGEGSGTVPSSPLRGSRSSLKESGGEGSGTVPRASSLKELSQADSGSGGGGTVPSSPRRSSRTSVKEIGRMGSGEGIGTLMSSPLRRSSRASVRDVSRAGSRERSGTRSAGGSSRDLSMGGRSSAGSSASLSSVSSGSHDDPRFIPIETLRSFLSSLLEFGQLSSIQEVKSSSSSSTTTTSSGEKIQKLVRAFERSGTSTSTEELPYFDDDAPSESAEASAGPTLRPRAETFSPKPRAGPYSLKPPPGPSARPRAGSTGKRRTGSSSEPPAEDKK